MQKFLEILKYVCIGLVIVLLVGFVGSIFKKNAEEEPEDTTDIPPIVEDNEPESELAPINLLYEVNFNGTSSKFGSIGEKYDGIHYAASEDGNSIDLVSNTIPSVNGSVWSGKMLNHKIRGNSYTIVFTVYAPDNQSVGIFFKWRDGFFVNPMNNTYSVGHCGNDGADVERYVETTEYNGNGRAFQAYAIEISNGDIANKDGKYECSVYKLYAVVDGEWTLICALDEETRQEIAWTESDYEFMIQLARVTDGESNVGTVNVRNMSIYEGNVATRLYAPTSFDSGDDTIAYDPFNDGYTS